MEEMRGKEQKVFSTPRLVIGIISIILFVIISLQSCVAGVGNTLTNSGEVSGSSGLLLSISFLVSGIISVCLRKKGSKSSFIIPACFYLIGSMIASLTFGTYFDLAIWAGLGAFFGALYLFFMFKLHSSNKVITYIVPALLFIIIIAFINLSGTSNTGNKEIKNETMDNEVDSNSKVKEGDKKKANDKKNESDKPFELDTENIFAKYTGYEIEKDYDGKDCLVVYFDFTNKSEEAISASMATYIQAFQNGVECDNAYLDDEIYENSSKDIKKGTTVKAACAFELKDTSDVELEVSESFSFENEKSKMTIKIK